MITILPAYEGDALEQVIRLSQEYAEWMLIEVGKRYPEIDKGEMASEHEYDDLRKKFPGEHVPPRGGLFVARIDDKPAGSIAFGPLDEETCEVRTLYVLPTSRGAGVGKKLVETVLNAAREAGYKRARLDTLPFMESALKLYRSFGFYDIEPYLNMSEAMKKRICFLEMKLAE